MKPGLGKTKEPRVFHPFPGFLVSRFISFPPFALSLAIRKIPKFALF
jgi:hypothetical protein